MALVTIWFCQLSLRTKQSEKTELKFRLIQLSWPVTWNAFILKLVYFIQIPCVCIQSSSKNCVIFEQRVLKLLVIMMGGAADLLLTDCTIVTFL